MKVNKFKSLALGLAISAVSSAALAASATLTMINAPQGSGSISEMIGVSEQGKVSFMNFTYGNRRAINTWSKSTGLSKIAETVPYYTYGGAGAHSIPISLDGSRVAVLNGSTSVIYNSYDQHTYVYTNGVEQVISGSAFASFFMSGDGNTLGGADASNQPAIMDIDTGEITTISIPNVNLTSYAVKLISDDGETLLLEPYSPYSTRAYYYLVDRLGNIKSSIARTSSGNTWDTIHQVWDLSGDGSTLSFTRGGHYCDNGTRCIQSWQWTQETGMVQVDGMVIKRPNLLNRTGSIMTKGTEIWDNVAGNRDLVSVLQAKGVDTTGWSDMNLYNVSSNGKYLVGTGTYGGSIKHFLIENNAEPICTVPAF